MQEKVLLPEFKLRPVDDKRLRGSHDIFMDNPTNSDKWYIHSVLAQCFLPYRDQKDEIFWSKKNGNCTLDISAGRVQMPDGELKILGLPYGAKPRLFMSKLQTEAIRNQSPIIPVKTSMTGMLKELGYTPQGGKSGNIASFKKQTARLAACRFRIFSSHNSDKGTISSFRNADIFKSMDLWFPKSPEQQTLWPTEIILTDEFYENLKEHAIPYDFRGLRLIQNNARAMDIFLWLTQRLYRIPSNKPLMLRWSILYEMFGGGISKPKNFPAHFKKALLAAITAYPEAKTEEIKGGFVFKQSPPPIQKVKIGYGG